MTVSGPIEDARDHEGWLVSQDACRGLNVELRQGGAIAPGADMHDPGGNSYNVRRNATRSACSLGLKPTPNRWL